MKHPVALFAIAALSVACLDVAHAQPRGPRRAPAVDASVSDAGPRDARWVVQRSAGAWLPTCVASAGCVAPRAVPRCVAPQPNQRVVATQSFAQVIDRRFQLAGQFVAVRGRLSAGAGCTEMGCTNGVCCNHCRGAVALTGEARSSLRALSLGAVDEAAFTCAGDDSGLCCGTAVPAGDVVVRGVLRAVTGSGGAWRIESPTLCAE
jgi:hypothetical protein